MTESDGGSTVSVRCYTYDTAGRLAGVYSAADVAMATCTGSPIASYGFNANGNRVSSTGAATVATSAATIDEQDRLMALTVGGVATTFAYTARGELTTRTAGSDVTTYRYDARGALASVTLPDASVVQYRNDPQGRRIERSYGGETRRWLYDGLRIVREEIGPTPTGGASFAASVVRTFVYGTRGHVPDLVLQGTATYRVVTDHLGSVRQVVDTATGDVVAARSYDAWGRVTSDTTSGGFVALPQAYAGGIYDAQTGLVRFGARDYDSVLGRWTAKDPIGFEGGDSELYGYVLADPMNRLDSQGTTSLRLNTNTGMLIVDPEQQGRRSYSIPISTGGDRPGTPGHPGLYCTNNWSPACEAASMLGPIPRGSWYIRPSELSDPGAIHDFFWNLLGDWGDWRVRIRPARGTNTRGRTEMFMHGGGSPGTNGCVDIGGGADGNPTTDQLERDLLSDPDNYVPLVVQ